MYKSYHQSLPYISRKILDFYRYVQSFAWQVVLQDCSLANSALDSMLDNDFSFSQFSSNIPSTMMTANGEDLGNVANFTRRVPQNLGEMSEYLCNENNEGMEALGMYCNPVDNFVNHTGTASGPIDNTAAPNSDTTHIGLHCDTIAINAKSTANVAIAPDSPATPDLADIFKFFDNIRNSTAKSQDAVHRHMCEESGIESCLHTIVVWDGLGI